jgi:ATP-dependent helicase/nuclease subunit B
MSRVSLTLLAGPANAGKVALLLERYLARLEEEPFLIVPNRSDVDRVEHDLLQRAGALLGGSIGTFDDLFRRIADDDPKRRPVATDVQRTLIGRRIAAGSSRRARSTGYVDSLLQALGELESGLVSPDRVDGDLGSLYRAYLEELERLGLWDRDLLRARATERLASELDAWHGEPVFAYGFEDLTAAEWGLVEALAGRAELTISMPYEAGRAAFAALQPTVEDLAALAQGRLEELPPRFAEFTEPAIAHVERGLFADAPPPGPPIDGAVRFFEGAGSRGALELVADEVLGLIRAGTAAEAIGVVCPSLDRWRAPLDTAFGAFGIPYALDGMLRLGQTPFGEALLALLRFAWLGGSRADLFTYLRSPFSGLSRYAVDFVEGRLRGRAVTVPERIEEEAAKLRGTPLPALDGLRGPAPVPAVAELLQSMLRSAYGLEAPPAGDQALRDLRAHEAARRTLDELEGWERMTTAVSHEDVVAALERTQLRAARSDEAGRVAVLDLLRARTRRFDVVFVLGLEEGSLPRRSRVSPFLDDELRRLLGARLVKADPVSRDRYLFYTACTRATRRLYLVREAAAEDGTPREPGPFWEEVRTLFGEDEAVRWTRTRPLAQLTWTLEAAPSERERLRALAELSERDEEGAASLARANGWERRLQRARTAFERRTRLRHPLVLAQLGERTTFNVTELERFADCSSAWFVERFLNPRTIDPEVDAKLRGSVAHSALHKFFSGLPRELGIETLSEERVEDAVRFVHRCLDEALAGIRMELTELQRRELAESLRRDLEQLVRLEATGELPLVPRRFEVSFGSERSAPELQRGLDLGGITLSGKIDRIDVDPFSARGIVVDYKSGKSAHSATEIEKELRLQIPLYMLVLRDLVGIEPLGGVYRPLGGQRKARGLLRADARDDALPGFVKSDYLAEGDFWARVESARELAGRLAERMRGGDILHDPKGGACPSWCDLWTVCRIRRA